MSDSVTPVLMAIDIPGDDSKRDKPPAALNVDEAHDLALTALHNTGARPLLFCRRTSSDLSAGSFLRCFPTSKVALTRHGRRSSSSISIRDRFCSPPRRSLFRAASIRMRQFSKPMDGTGASRLKRTPGGLGVLGFRGGWPLASLRRLACVTSHPAKKAAPANPRLERTGRRTAHHGRAARAAGRSTAGR